MSISPGPVNMISLSTGVNHGVKRAMPFIIGATLGFCLLLLLIGLGVGGLINKMPLLLTFLCFIGSGYICFIGFNIAVSKPNVSVKESNLPSFKQGFLLQWLNPKAWVACLVGTSAFNLSESVGQLLLFVSVYFFFCYLSISAWAVIGDKLRQMLTNTKMLKVFNRLMGGLLIMVAVYLCYLQIYS